MSKSEDGRVRGSSDPASRAANSLSRPWYADVPRSGRSAYTLGFALIGVGVIGFGAWASTAPLDGAVIAPGVFIATSQNKVVQHLEGGIIRDILVREGEVVQEGQTLLRLDDTQAKADLSRLTLRQSQLRATAARLASEAEQLDHINFPHDLVIENDPDVRVVLDSQRAIFAARRDKLQREISINDQTIASLRERKRGEEARLISSTAQLELIREELIGKEKLYAAGLVRKSEYFALKRAEANLAGEVARSRADMADIDERITGGEEQIRRVRSVYIQAAVEELQPIAGELQDLRERISAAQSVLTRIEVRAPVKGAVVKVNYHTAGGVIRPGNDILTLVPLGDELIIEARVRPSDIDNLAAGQDALVRLTALSQRVTPMVIGRLVYVSPDSVPSERGQGESYYVSRIKLEPRPGELKDFVPAPGMPVEVYVKVAQRTFLQYLLQPLFDTMTRAFKET